MITRIDPSDWRSRRPTMLQLDVEAGSPVQAIDEINTWADEYGYTRSSEWPRPVFVDGHKRYRSVCYLWTEEEAAAALREQEAVDRRRERIPVEHR